jgi:seryl-tRNA synthetase
VLDLKEVARNFEAVAARLQDRGGTLDLGTFQALFQERKGLYVEVESLQARRNAANEEMKRLAKENPQGIDAARGELRAVSSSIKEKEVRLAEVEGALEKLMYDVPNVPAPSVPVGKGAEENQVVRTWGQKPAFLFPPKQHFDVGEKLGQLDLERAAKVSGARFWFLKGDLARLERALVSFMIDAHTQKGYLEILPPYLVNRQAMVGTGQLPKFEEDAFKTAGPQELFLIPTAEVPVTNYHQDEILDGEKAQ